MTQKIAVKIPSVETWKRWLHAEHSMIRRFELSITVCDVPYFVHVQMRTHHVGCEWYVRSQRPTAINPVDYDRRKAPQDAPVDLIMDTNPQALINIAQVRLCSKADDETRQVWDNIAQAIHVHDDPYIAAIARVMMPRCKYRGGVCYELRPCGLYLHFETLIMTERS